MQSEKPVKLSRYDARRVAQQVRRGEQEPPIPVERAKGAAAPGPCVYMEVTTQVTLKSGSTLGKGLAKLKIVTYDSSNVATIADHPDTTPYPIYSGAAATGSTIAAGRLVIAAPMYGRFHVVVDFCP